MLMDILMEALMSMDDESLDYVLESCDAEELEIIDSAMELTMADRNDPDVKEYIQNMRKVRKDFAGDKYILNAMKKHYKDSTRMILDNKQEIKNITNRQLERIKNASNERLNKGLDEINSYFNPKIQALQKNINELKGQK